MLFPQLGDVYLNERDRGIIARMESFYSESITINQSFWGEADTDTRFYCNDQTLWQNLYGNLPANRRRNLCFNRIMRVVNMIDGHQRRNRKSIVMTPKENGDNETADQFTKVIMSLCQQEGILETISDSFHGGLVTGMNLLQIWLDYRNDPISGDIKVDNCSYNAFLIDPYFRKADLSDCNGIWKRSYMTKREAISLMPQFTDEILGLPGNQYGNKDGKFQFMPESYQYGYKNLLAYDEFYYRDFRAQKLLADAKTGEVMEWKGNDKDLQDFLILEKSVTVLETEIPTVNLAIVIQGKVFYNDRLPTGADHYPFVPVFAYYNPQLPYFESRVQGVVRGLRDSQFLYNRRKIIELDILESQINSGFIYKENSLVNPKDVFLSGQGRGLALKEEAQMTDVQQIQSPVIPPTTIELSRALGEEINQIAGVSEELLGFDNKDTLSGFHSMLKQSAGVTTLGILFDHLDRSIKLLGDRMAEIIQINYTPGKIQKILEGKQPAPLFYNKAFGKYHAAVEEGLNTTTQKQMQMAQMLMLKEAGVPISPQDLLEASTLQNKKTVIENMQKEQQAQQQQQQQTAQVQMQEMQARTNLANSRSEADKGLAVERISRVEENRALALQKLSEANKNDEQALLEKVKILKEIGHMDLDEIGKLINMANLLKVQEQQTVQKPQQEGNNGIR